MTVHLTDDSSVSHQVLHECHGEGWHEGQGALFVIAWRARGPARSSSPRTSAPQDALLGLLGRVNLDEVANGKQVGMYRNPSGRKGEAAAAAHMAGGRHCRPERRVAGKCLFMQNVTERYRQLRLRKVDEDEPLQAVLRRRSVLTTLVLSKPGWEAFSRYCAPDGAHAVILTGCGPQRLALLISWASGWEDRDRFTVEDVSVLEIPRSCAVPVCIYDMAWYEEDLTPAG
ncbi:hypothetical protein VUR80DRAFT_6081 [Thermomyces stellatus]